MAGMLGKHISGRYKLLSVVGGGGMAVVYKAHDLILDRVVAVKVLRSEFSDDEEFIRRFRREARAVASLSHPNIVDIYDIGDESDDLYYIVMEYIEGETLKQLIKRRAPLPIEKALDIMDRITSAIAHAHDHRIVHRDIKPHNILLDTQGNAKVTDFGIAVAMTSATITHTNSVIGSAHYFSPEQAKGGYANTKSDIYSLGIVLFEMVTGELPFSGTSPISVALKHLQEEIPEPRELNAAIPQSVENVILKALTKDPIHRYENVEDMRQDMQTAMDPDRLHEAKFEVPDDDQETTKVMPVASGDAGDGSNNGGNNENGGSDGETPGGGKKKKKKRRKKIWLLLLLLLLLLGGGTAAAFIFIPSWLHVDDTAVPKVVGMDYHKARDILKKQNFDVKSEEATNDKYDKGKVARQDPAAKTKVKEGSTVHVSVSTGPEKITLENYAGKDKDSVKLLLKEFDFKKVDFVPEHNDDYLEDTVFKQDPEPDTEVIPAKTELTLTYSQGPETTEVPDLSGSTREEAEDKLKDQGLSTDYQGKEYSDSFDEGKVSSQSPDSGEDVDQGASVQFKISKGSKPESDSDSDSDSDAEPISFTQPVKVEGASDHSKDDKDPSVDVKIVYSDEDHDKETFIEEKIKKTKTYKLPLKVEPDKKITVWVYSNGDLRRTINKSYDDVKKETD